MAHRKEALAEALGLVKPQAPHATTYSHVLNNAIDIGAFEQIIYKMPLREFYGRRDDSATAVGYMYSNSKSGGGLRSARGLRAMLEPRR